MNLVLGKATTKAHAPSFMYIHAQFCMYIHAQSYMHIYAQSFMYIHAQSYMHIHARSYMYIHTHRFFAAERKEALTAYDKSLAARDQQVCANIYACEIYLVGLLLAHAWIYRVVLMLAYACIYRVVLLLAYACLYRVVLLRESIEEFYCLPTSGSIERKVVFKLS